MWSMAQYILRFRRINRNIFTAIRDGVKKVETRAHTTRYQRIKQGDAVMFVCGKERFKRQVKRVQHFKNITTILRVYKLRDVNPFVSSKKELEETYWSFPGYNEKIRKFGLIAIELTLVKR